MLIPCPHCGPRDSGEFAYAGDATRPRPPDDAPEAAWCDYLYARANPMGRHREVWMHGQGCRAVLIVERDTVTHEVFGAELAGAHGTARPGPAVPAFRPAYGEAAE